MGKFAEKTQVSEEKSRMEIETILRRYGADAFSYGWEETRALIAFRANNRQIRFEIAMPDRNSEAVTKYKDRNGHARDRSTSAADAEYQQRCRQKWRALCLVVKAKLEAVDSGISEFEEEFLAYIVLPDGSTVGKQIKPHIEQAYIDGKMPTRLLLAAGN